MKTLIIGCGYVGLPLALQLQAQGQEIFAWVRSGERATELAPYGFAQTIIGSVGEEALWKDLRGFDQVVHCASSIRGGPAAYVEVFVEGVRLMNEHQPLSKRLLISSTSVYGQTSGEIVTEDSLAEPGSETSRILLQAENAALAGGQLAVRSAGIYGPHRTHLFEKLRRGEAAMEEDGLRWINQIHRDDLVAGIVLLLEKGNPGAIYNACDDEPVSQRDYYHWCSEFLEVPMPPSAPRDPAKKRGNTNKRVSNSKLRALGWTPRFPSFREGLEGLPFHD